MNWNGQSMSALHKPDPGAQLPFLGTHWLLALPATALHVNALGQPASPTHA